MTSSAGWCRLWCWQTTGHRRWLWCWLAQLQSANVSDDGPAILHGNLRSVRWHRAPAVGDRVEEVTHGRLAQAVVVERRRATKTAADDHAVAVARQTMTDATENVVALTSTCDCLFGNRKRERISVVRVGVLTAGSGRRRWLCSLSRRTGLLFFTGEQNGISAQKSARYRAGDWRPARDAVNKKRRAAIGLHLRLVLHVAPAGCARQAHAQN